MEILIQNIRILKFSNKIIFTPFFNPWSSDIVGDMHDFFGDVCKKRLQLI